jgi:hypothetical protein
VITKKQKMMSRILIAVVSAVVAFECVVLAVPSQARSASSCDCGNYQSTHHGFIIRSVWHDKKEDKLCQKKKSKVLSRHSMKVKVGAH